MVCASPFPRLSSLGRARVHAARCAGGGDGRVLLGRRQRARRGCQHGTGLLVDGIHRVHEHTDHEGIRRDHRGTDAPRVPRGDLRRDGCRPRPARGGSRAERRLRANRGRRRHRPPRGGRRRGRRLDGPRRRVLHQVDHRRDPHDVRRCRRDRSRRRHLAVAPRVRRRPTARDHAHVAHAHVRRPRQPVPERRRGVGRVCGDARRESDRVPGGHGVLLRQLPLPRGRAPGGGARRRRLRHRRPRPRHRAPRDDGYHLARGALGPQPRIRRPDHGRRLRPFPGHAPARRHERRSPRALRRVGRRDRPQPGRRLRHRPRLLGGDHRHPALRPRLLARRRRRARPRPPS